MSAQDLLKELQHQPRARWPLLAQRPRFRNPEVVKALLRWACGLCRLNQGLYHAAAETAATLTRAMPGESALRAWALAELANSRRIKGDYESATGLMADAETVLPGDAPAEIRGFVLRVKASLNLDVLELDVALAASEEAFEAFLGAGQPLESAKARAVSAAILMDALQHEAARAVLDETRRILIADSGLEEQLTAGTVPEEAYLSMVGLVQLNGLNAWVLNAEHESSHRSRHRQIDWVLRGLAELRVELAEKLPERELNHVDWVEARALMSIGLYNAAIPRLEGVRARFEDEDHYGSAASAGNDLLFARAARGDLTTTAEEAVQMLARYRGRNLQDFELRLLEQISRLPKRKERRYLHELDLWPPYSARMPGG